ELGLARELGVDALELAVEHRNRRLALQLDLFRLDVDLALVELLAERLRRQDDVVDGLQRAVPSEIDLRLARVRGHQRAVAPRELFIRARRLLCALGILLDRALLLRRKRLVRSL